MNNTSNVDEPRDSELVVDKTEILEAESEETGLSICEHSCDASDGTAKAVVCVAGKKADRLEKKWRRGRVWILLLLCLSGCIVFNEAIQAHLILSSERIKNTVFKSEDPMREFDRLRDAAIALQESKRYRAALILLDEAQTLTKPYGINNVYTARLLGIRAWCYFELGEHDKARDLMKRSIDMWYSTRGKRTSWAARGWHDLSKMCEDVESKRLSLDQAMWCATHSQGPKAMMTAEIWLEADRYQASSAPIGSMRAGHLSASQLEGLNAITEEGREVPERLFKYDELIKIDEALIKIVGHKVGAADKFDQKIVALLKEPVVRKKEILIGTSLVRLDDNLFRSIEKNEDALHLKATALNRLASLLHLMGKHEKAEIIDKEADSLFEREWMNYYNKKRRN